MQLPRFQLAEYLAQHEFSATHLFSCSDCDGLHLADLISYADDECSQLWNELKLDYTEPSGHRLLRAEIAGQYVGVDPDDVLINASAEESLYLAIQSLLQPGDHVVCTPGYAPYYDLPRALGCEVSIWYPQRDNRGWVFDSTCVDRMLNKNTKLLIVSFPHNPTGAHLSRVDFELLCEIADERGIQLLSDEVFRGVERSLEDQLPSAVDVSRNAIACSGLSKVFGLAGLRIGWMVSRDTALRRSLQNYRYYTTISNSAPSEVLALIALRNRQRILQQTRSVIEQNLSRLQTFFRGTFFEWSTPRGGTVGFAELQINESAAEFCRKAVQKAQIMIVPSEAFNLGTRNIRVGFGRKSLANVLHELECYLSVEYADA